MIIVSFLSFLQPIMWFIILTWLTHESSSMKLFLDGATASTFCFLHFYSHLWLQRFCEVTLDISTYCQLISGAWTHNAHQPQRQYRKYTLQLYILYILYIFYHVMSFTSLVLTSENLNSEIPVHGQSWIYIKYLPKSAIIVF